jgi:hypothetical protein
MARIIKQNQSQTRLTLKWCERPNRLNIACMKKQRSPVTSCTVCEKVGYNITTAKRRVRALRVVLDAPLLDHHLCLLQRIENLSVQAFVPQLPVEAFAGRL